MVSIKTATITDNTVVNFVFMCFYFYKFLNSVICVLAYFSYFFCLLSG
jgi:hypothetical protein